MLILHKNVIFNTHDTSAFHTQMKMNVLSPRIHVKTTSSAQTHRARINVRDVIERAPRVPVQHSKTASRVALIIMITRENAEVRNSVKILFGNISILPCISKAISSIIKQYHLKMKY